MSNMRQWLISREDYGFNFSLRMRQGEKGNYQVPKPLEMEELKPNTFVDPIMDLTEEDVHQMMDQLWIAGIRPSKNLAERDNIGHRDSEIEWLRETADHLMKKPKC